MESAAPKPITRLQGSTRPHRIRNCTNAGQVVRRSQPTTAKGPVDVPTRGDQRAMDVVGEPGGNAQAISVVATSVAAGEGTIASHSAADKRSPRAPWTVPGIPALRCLLYTSPSPRDS